MQMGSRLYLEKCSDRYGALVARAQRLFDSKDANAAIEAVQKAAHYAWFHHPGRFCDGALENISIALGQQLDRLSCSDIPRLPDEGAGTRRRVLHVTTRVFAIGGHTRWIANHVRWDAERRHSLAVLAQGAGPLRSELVESIAANGGRVHVCAADTSWLGRSKWLRQLARKHDDVILHSFPDEAATVVALASADLPSVAWVLHADHVFGLGPTVTDVCVALREEARKHAKERRSLARTELLPIPVRSPRAPISRAAARRSLGLGQSDLILLSLGSGYKLAPTCDRNFFRASARVLDRHPNARLFLIGLTAEELATYRVELHDRAHVLGIVPAPDAWQAAADLALEPFPAGSTTALLESVVGGSFPVPAFRAESPLLGTCIPTLEEHVPIAPDEDAWVALVNDLVSDAASRNAMWPAIRDSVLQNHGEQAFRRGVGRLHERLSSVKHAPHPIPVTKCEETKTDLAVSRFHEALPAWVG